MRILVLSYDIGKLTHRPSLRGCGPRFTTWNAAVRRAIPIPFMATSLARSALGFEQLKVEDDLHHIAKRDGTHTWRHLDVDTEVPAADLGRCLEAGVAGAAREVLDAAEFNG